eukprot:s5144_g1.t1
MSGGKPQMLMCYLCGREFGTRSLPIHEAQKPLAEQRPLPARPERLNAILMGNAAADAANAADSEMYNNYDQDVLEKCQWCGRTFNPTAMKSHAKSCTQERADSSAIIGAVTFGGLLALRTCGESKCPRDRDDRGPHGVARGAAVAMLGLAEDAEEDEVEDEEEDEVDAKDEDDDEEEDEVEEEDEDEDEDEDDVEEEDAAE